MRTLATRDSRRYGTLLYIGSTSPTLRVTYERIAEYLPVLNEGCALHLDDDGPHVAVTMRPFGATLLASPEGLRHQADMALSTLLQLGRFFTRSALAPWRVEFAGAPPDSVQPHAHFFAAPMTWHAPANRLLFAREALGVPLPRRDPLLHDILARRANELLPADGVAASSWMGQVRRAVVDALAGGRPDIDAVARSLAVSRRTLQRRLEAEGLTYDGLVDGVRFELSTRLLANPQRAIAEVAWTAGFRELSAFYRAFRRWSGKTPAEYRRGLAPGAALSPPCG